MKEVLIINPLIDRKTLKIVSCSRIVPIKRIHRILEALREIKDFPIEWTHIGGGELLEDIEKMAEGLPEQVTVNFTGTVANKDMYDTYASTPFYVFVNVSIMDMARTMSMIRHRRSLV